MDASGFRVVDPARLRVDAVVSGQPTPYSVVVRTFNSERTIRKTIVSLERQTCPPAEWIVVDSGSTDGTLALLPDGAVIRDNRAAEFNYSTALNDGVDLASHPFTLIISSHTTLDNPEAVAFALQMMNSDTSVGGAYFHTRDGESLEAVLIDERTFDGFNGLWNTCSIARTDLLRKRRFRPEVFAAEDQEWASWLFRDERMSIAQIRGGGLGKHNPRDASIKKNSRAYVSVAYFSHRELLGWDHIARVLWSAVWLPGFRAQPRTRLYRLVVAVRLACCHVRPPRSTSKYFR